MLRTQAHSTVAVDVNGPIINSGIINRINLATEIVIKILKIRLKSFQEYLNEI